ncbi:MAG TPA: AmmeMemoRadiSam system protein B [Terriglobia bacterium]|nr:AmmeMemoRadiSam system protein B [Terriglobia bacterium]
MQEAPVRPPAVAGRFYPADPEALAREVDACLGGEAGSEQVVAGALGCVAPHAGYQYSGRVAGAVYARLPARATYLILGPNHFGRGKPLAVMSRGAWLTPLGPAPIDGSLADELRRCCPGLEEDAAAHAEHSIEVQVPFLQRRFGGSIVPVAIGLDDYAALVSLGHGVAEAVSRAAKPLLIVASSDFSHYEPDRVTRVKDRRAIDRILALDPQGLYDVVHRERISMCGYGPVVAMLVAVRDLGGRQATLVKYATSADAGGDPDAVVGYAGIVIS